jgi:ubiquinone/menaquinone biosynthesis C-methylase UbiE
MSHDATDTTVAPAYDATEVYALGADTDETARLQRQSEELQPEARALLGRLRELGLRPGQTAIDLGCGPRGILDLLAEAVGPDGPSGRGGRVVGLDADPAHVAAARQYAASRGFANVEVLAGDARHTGLPAESFDLVHTRTLLVTIPEPAEVVAEMVRLARPGGLVASQEADAEFSICYPPLPEWDRLWSLFHASFPRAGADLRLGRRLPELFREAGLTDVGATVYASCYPAGHSRRTVIPDLVRSLHPVILSLGLAGERELADVDAAVRAHLADPRTLIMPHLLVTAWGRKP